MTLSKAGFDMMVVFSLPMKSVGWSEGWNEGVVKSKKAGKKKKKEKKRLF